MSTTAASDGARPSWLLEALSSAPMVEALERIAAIAAAERAERGR